MPDDQTLMWRVVVCAADKAEYWLNKHAESYALHAYLPVNRGDQEWVHIVLLHKSAFVAPKIQRPIGMG